MVKLFYQNISFHLSTDFNYFLFITIWKDKVKVFRKILIDQIFNKFNIKNFLKKLSLYLLKSF